MMVWVNEDGESECFAVMAKIDVLPIDIGMRHPKGGPLPPGALSREHCPKRDAFGTIKPLNPEKAED